MMVIGMVAAGRSLLPHCSVPLLSNSILIGSFSFSLGIPFNILVFPQSLLLQSAFISTSQVPGHGVSSPSNKTCVQEFLQKSCGLSQKQAMLASKPLLHLRSTRKPEQVLTLFRERGFSDALIVNLLVRWPRVLVSSVSKNLQPKLRVFEDLGMAGNEVGYVISKDPRLLRISLDRKIVPVISFLQKILQSDEDVGKVLIRGPRILYTSLEKTLKPNLLFLQSHGVNRQLLLKFLVRKPRLFLSRKTVIEDVITRVERLGVQRHSGMFPHAVFVVSSMAKKTLERKMRFLASLGLSGEEVLIAFRRSPYILAISERNLQIHVDFLVNTLKLEPSVIMSYPQFFMSSMEAKIIPRYRVFQMLQSMQLPRESFSVMNMLSSSEKSFLEKYVFKYDKSSGLYEIYKGMDAPISSLRLEVKDR